MRNRNSNFGYRGTFTCSACGRKTRATGVQDYGSTLCPEDYELAGIYNEYQDGHEDWSWRQVKGLCEAITSKGGTLDGDAKDLLELAEKIREQEGRWQKEDQRLALERDGVDE